MKRLTFALAALAMIFGAALTPAAHAEPYDHAGCAANPMLPCGPDGNPLAPYWQDSPGGPFIDPNCAKFDTCVPGEIESP